MSKSLLIFIFSGLFNSIWLYISSNFSLETFDKIFSIKFESLFSKEFANSFIILFSLVFNFNLSINSVCLINIWWIFSSSSFFFNMSSSDSILFLLLFSSFLLILISFSFSLSLLYSFFSLDFLINLLEIFSEWYFFIFKSPFSLFLSIIKLLIVDINFSSVFGWIFWLFLSEFWLSWAFDCLYFFWRSWKIYSFLE